MLGEITGKLRVAHFALPPSTNHSANFKPYIRWFQRYNFRDYLSFSSIISLRYSYFYSQISELYCTLHFEKIDELQRRAEVRLALPWQPFWMEFVEKGKVDTCSELPVSKSDIYSGIRSPKPPIGFKRNSKSEVLETRSNKETSNYFHKWRQMKDGLFNLDFKPLNHRETSTILL